MSEFCVLKEVRNHLRQQNNIQLSDANLFVENLVEEYRKTNDKSEMGSRDYLILRDRVHHEMLITEGLDYETRKVLMMVLNMLTQLMKKKS